MRRARARWRTGLPSAGAGAGLQQGLWTELRLQSGTKLVAMTKAGAQSVPSRWSLPLRDRMSILAVVARSAMALKGDGDGSSQSLLRQNRSGLHCGFKQERSEPRSGRGPKQKGRGKRLRRIVQSFSVCSGYTFRRRKDRYTAGESSLAVANTEECRSVGRGVRKSPRLARGAVFETGLGTVLAGVV
jgi:hypothetical protein